MSKKKGALTLSDIIGTSHKTMTPSPVQRSTTAVTLNKTTTTTTTTVVNKTPKPSPLSKTTKQKHVVDDAQSSQSSQEDHDENQKITTANQFSQTNADDVTPSAPKQSRKRDSLSKNAKKLHKSDFHRRTY